MRMTISNIPEGYTYSQFLGTATGFGDFNGPVEIGDNVRLGQVEGWDRTKLANFDRPLVTVTDDSESERPPLVLWQIDARIAMSRYIDDEQWNASRIVPAFYLDAGVSAVNTAEEAEALATEILMRSVVDVNYGDVEVTVTLHVTANRITYKLAEDQS